MYQNYYNYKELVEKKKYMCYNKPKRKIPPEEVRNSIKETGEHL